MKKKQNIREIIYVSGNEAENKCFYSYGIEFHEFMACMNNRPENLILLKHDFDNAEWNQLSRFDYVTSQRIDELINDYVYGYGDFCWVDFNIEEDLDQLTNLQIAELLFFGHLAKPLHEIPKVRFSYYAHDDGWFNKLYVTNIEEYEMMISKVIEFKLEKLTRRTFINIPRDISRVLLELTEKGLFINLSKIRKDNDIIQIPITEVGHYREMDSVYDLKDKITEYKMWLHYSKNSWKLIQEG
ncbi:hypothetical protein [Paenibacillus sp. HB172176]|uniref:hypothetical protein n=1 Tax=Paenibacillus sp. HB172176 TaxID=2493690 RepID=UPI00143BC440|nr:hypothetical protein [Paenibacillus sp. HB172176]